MGARRQDESFFSAIGWIIIAGWYFVPQDDDFIQEVSNDSATKFWVTVDRLNRRTCPDKTCGVVGRLFFRNGVTPLEISENWVRISPYYYASCINGKSEYVDSGNNECDVKNGILEDRLAEWVSMRFLSKIRPPNPADSATGRELIVAQSDDFHLYRDQFVQAAETLIETGQCSVEDFNYLGGFYKTPNPAEPTYGIYCGGVTVAHRIYVNVKTGKISR